MNILILNEILYNYQLWLYKYYPALARCNTDYTVSSSYPKWSIVPASITDSQVVAAARQRVGGRFPCLATLHREVPLVRASHCISSR